MPRISLPRSLTVAALFAAALVVTACGSSATPTPDVAGEGETIRLHYTGTLDDGTVFDSSSGRDPIAFVVGAGQVIPGFEDAVRGMIVGETKTVTIEPDQAYGIYRDELIGVVPRELLPADLAVGDQLESASGQVALVIEITDTEVLMDANHPLAGQALTFELEIVSIE